MTSIPTAVAFGFTEMFAYVVLPVSGLFVDVARPMPCRPLSWLVEPVTVAPVVADSRMPVERELSTAAPRTVTQLVQVSTRMPLLADPPAVTWSTVTPRRSATRTPAKFCRRS